MRVKVDRPKFWQELLLLALAAGPVLPGWFPAAPYAAFGAGCRLGICRWRLGICTPTPGGLAHLLLFGDAARGRPLRRSKSNIRSRARILL